jgi:hypothetical protein
MNFKLVTCYKRQKYPKVNVAAKKSVKKSNGKKKRKKSSSTSSHRHHRTKNTYVSSNLFSKNFYPANYFFQDDPKIRVVDSRVGVNDRNGFLITRNTPHLTQQRRSLPSSQALSQQYLWKVGAKSDHEHFYLIFHQIDNDGSGRLISLWQSPRIASKVMKWFMKRRNETIEWLLEEE